jgi:predicted AlkP superfamily pyrophosphatase or phosphodiesterase
VHKTVVINAVGLTPELIGEHTPRLRAFRDAGAMASIGSMLPAVTTSVQSTYLTGTYPSEHGIVGNGWYFRDECEIKFWKQSGKLVQRPRIWERAKQLDPTFTCANIFWWYAMYCGCDYTVTPRPMYLADGRKLPDIWTSGPKWLRNWLQGNEGQFPLFDFWGPATSIESSHWISDAAIEIELEFHPTLTLVYLPHLDYCLQRRGPDPDSSSMDLRDLDKFCGELIDHFSSIGDRIIILSEYGIVPVSRPVHLNRVLREAGLLAIRDELGHELLDAGASEAFAVADHQIAHVYVNNPAKLDLVRELLSSTPGVERILDANTKRDAHLDHPRSGELVAVADAQSWFTYYYWLDDSRAPDFARTVDIHRKPGYDPAELFIDPAIRFPKLKIATKLLRKKLGFRYLMDVIPLDASLVKGSHGRLASSRQTSPLLMTNSPDLLSSDYIEAPNVFDVILRHLMDP